jgi:signal transduction histidine kinase
LKNLLCIDGNNLFVGTNQGLLKINLKPATIRYIDDNSFANQDRLRIRRKILESPSGKLILTGHPYSYLADNDSSFTLISDTTMSVFDATLIGNHVFVATEDNGLKRIDLRDKKTEDIPLENGKKNGNYTAIDADLTTGDIYIGGIGTLIRYNLKSQKKQFFNLPDRSARIRYIFRDTLFDRLWLGTEKGLYYTGSDPNTLSLFPVFNQLSGRIIGELRHRKGSNELWVGHENGVEVVDLKTLQIIHRVPPENFYNTRVTGILEDSKGRMWFSTYYGLVGYDPTNGDFIRLNKKNRLINLEFNYKSCFVRKNGELVFGGLNGYDIIQPENFIFNRTEKTGTITGVQVFSEEDTTMQMLNTDNQKRIVFNTDKEHLRIYLSSKNLVKADQYNYQFKLDDGAWTNTNRQSHIKIIKLDPGTYNLQMRAFNEYGVPIEFDNVTLIAEQSFLKSRYFLGFLTLLSFASMFSVLAVFRSSRKKERELKESIAMDLHDEVGTILTRTLYIQNQTKPDDPLRTAIPKYLNEALFSLRVYIQTMHKESISIRGLRDEIQETMTATFASTNIKLEFQCNCKEEIKLDSKLYRDIKLCIYELANNILKHSNATFCKLELSLASSLLSIKIEDDGNLIDLENLENKGNGINNLRKRVERNAGKIAFEIPKAGKGLITTISFKLD